MSTPKVCVVIPCFNHGKYIDEAINSVLNQTFTDLEIVVVDDGSTDEFTRKKINELNYPKTRVIIQNNSGPVVARNNAISSTQAEYILPLDADDHFERTFLQKAVQILDAHSSIGAVNCYTEAFGAVNYISYPKAGGSENFISKNNANICLLYRRICWEQVKGYSESMSDGYEDWDFWISVTCKGWKIHVIEEILFFYRKHLESRDTIAQERHHLHVRNIVSKHLNFFKDNILTYVQEKELEVLNLKATIKKNERKYYDSNEYKIGSMLLLPYKFFKKLFK